MESSLGVCVGTGFFAGQNMVFCNAKSPQLFDWALVCRNVRLELQPEGELHHAIPLCDKSAGNGRHACQLSEGTAGDIPDFTRGAR